MRVLPLLLVPSTAVAVAFGPALVMAPAPTDPPKALPAVHVEAIQLAGIGQDIYNAITPVVQTVVGDVSYLINFTPIIGRIIAAQTNIDYFQGIQPTIAATVDYSAAVLHDLRNIGPLTRAYVDTLVGIGYGLVSAQLRFLGFNELPPRPAANRPPSPRVAAAVKAPASRPGRPAAAVKPSPRAKAAASHQARKSADTRRQKSTTGRTNSPI